MVSQSSVGQQYMKTVILACVCFGKDSPLFISTVCVCVHKYRLVYRMCFTLCLLRDSEDTGVWLWRFPKVLTKIVAEQEQDFSIGAVSCGEDQAYSKYMYMFYQVGLCLTPQPINSFAG